MAIFPDVETGLKAQKDLLVGPSYRSLSLGDAIKKYSGEKKGKELETYRQGVNEWSGVSLDRRMGSLSPDEFGKVIGAIHRQEGYTVPDPYTEEPIVTKGTVTEAPPVRGEEGAPAEDEEEGLLFDKPVEEWTEEDRKRAMASAAYLDRDHPLHGRAVRKVRDWFERAYPEGGGRTDPGEGGGPVHVREHVRDGGKTPVRAHDRSPPSR